MSPTVSIVIPTANEVDDIGGTLDALAALDPPPHEVVVVDASTDGTADVVRDHRLGARLLIQSERGGRSVARNEGIRSSSSDIVVILNADVRVPADLLARLRRHYDAGADYVLVESRVSNTDAAAGRYVQACHELDYPDRPDVAAQMNWTEGFSCRREAALAVGLFPEGGDEPLLAGEDGWFGEKLAGAGCRKVFDRSIVVTHVVPATPAGFLRQRVERGRGWAQILRERHGWSGPRVAAVAAKVAAIRALQLIVPVAAVRRGWRLAGRSSRGRRDVVVLAALAWIDTLASGLGLASGAAAAVFRERRRR